MGEVEDVCCAVQTDGLQPVVVLLLCYCVLDRRGDRRGMGRPLATQGRQYCHIGPSMLSTRTVNTVNRTFIIVNSVHGIVVGLFVAQSTHILPLFLRYISRYYCRCLM